VCVVSKGLSSVQGSGSRRILRRMKLFSSISGVEYRSTEACVAAVLRACLTRCNIQKYPFSVGTLSRSKNAGASYCTCIDCTGTYNSPSFDLDAMVDDGNGTNIHPVYSRILLLLFLTLVLRITSTPQRSTGAVRGKTKDRNNPPPPTPTQRRKNNSHAEE
jgi:hypothetical protein